MRLMIRLFPSFVALAMLAACARGPIVTNNEAVAETAAPTVSICYSAQSSTRESLIDLALQRCPEGTGRVSVWDHDTFLNDCPIAAKNRVTFICQR